jgi:FG-GAP-like repeat
LLRVCARCRFWLSSVRFLVLVLALGVSRLLCLAILFPTLAVAQTILPVAPPKTVENPSVIARSRVMAAHSSTSSPSSRAKTTPNGNSSATAHDASPTSGFAGFYAAPFYQTIFDPNEAGAIALINGDFNHDGKPDLVSVTFAGGIAVLLNDGTGGFGSPIISQISPIPGNAPDATIDYRSAYAVDLNGDGYTDILVTTTSFQIAVLLNHKDGTFPATMWLPLQNPNPSSTTAANGTVAQGKTTANGGVDLVSVQSFNPAGASQTTILVETLLNDGSGNFPTQKTSTYTAPVTSTLETNPIATLADVNQDGKLDLLLARDGVKGSNNESPLYVDVLLGLGDGTFQPPGAAGTISFAGSGAVSNSSYLLTANLVAGSSVPDIVLGNFYGIYIAKGNGDGTFQPATQILTEYAEPAVQIADLNGDGKLDLAINSIAGVTTFLGNGDGTFGGIAGAVVSGDPENGVVQQLTLADFNGDGKIDLATQNDVNGDVELASGNGDGTFHAAPVLFSPANPVIDPRNLYLQAAGDITGTGTDQVIGVGYTLPSSAVDCPHRQRALSVLPC